MVTETMNDAGAVKVDGGDTPAQPTAEEQLEQARSVRRSWQRQRIEAGLCVSCSKRASPHYVRCDECQEKHRQENRVKAQERRAAGICASCNNSSLPDGTRCQSCRDKRRTGKQPNAKT